MNAHGTVVFIASARFEPSASVIGVFYLNALFGGGKGVFVLLLKHAVDITLNLYLFAFFVKLAAVTIQKVVLVVTFGLYLVTRIKSPPNALLFAIAIDSVDYLLVYQRVVFVLQNSHNLAFVVVLIAGAVFPIVFKRDFFFHHSVFKIVVRNALFFVVEIQLFGFHHIMMNRIVERGVGVMVAVFLAVAVVDDVEGVAFFGVENPRGVKFKLGAQTLGFEFSVGEIGFPISVGLTVAECSFARNSSFGVIKTVVAVRIYFRLLCITT